MFLINIFIDKKYQNRNKFWDALKIKFKQSFCTMHNSQICQIIQSNTINKLIINNLCDY